MKIDLQKAYDSIEWEFVRAMLAALNFPAAFSHLILECVISPTYTLSLNGESFGYFKGKRGLRQGDPLSPLIFMISYFFCKGDRMSITGMIRAFESFSRASGLKMNKNKSSIYSNGVEKHVINEIVKVSGITRRSLPFKYLGIPIAARKLSVLECSSLVDKVAGRIRALGCRKLRISCGQDWIMIMERHWWLGIKSARLKSMVVWASRTFGGWNKAAQKKDHLWVRWVHSVFIKSENWVDYQPNQSGSWAWRKLCRLKNQMHSGYVGNWWMHNQNPYTIQSGYEWLNPAPVKAPWYQFVWVKEALHKHSLLGG
ncbi:uncharacterized protein LOC141649623 [Silene latifolia]|uniref:uncharacterized protein LOC141649623 n=1 Tax=Silene latifolia TaxID=37657 RepID=UPI003D784E8A